MFALAFAAIPASIAVAVWRHQLFGVDVVLRRAVAYGALTALAGAVYTIVVTGAGVVGSDRRLGAPGAAAAVVVASAARSRVRSFVDRRLFGLRHDPLAVIALVNEIGDTGDASPPSSGSCAPSPTPSPSRRSPSSMAPAVSSRAKDGRRPRRHGSR